MTPPDRDDSAVDPLAWVGEPGRAIVELAFGGRRGSGVVEPSFSRHLALLPVDALELDLSDPLQRQFGDYELLERLGEGGMGVVYRARQASLDREVAIKLLAAGPWASREFVARFTREAQNAARMQHPNIVAIYEVGSAEELHFFSMRLVRGSSLAACIREQGRLPAQRAATMMRTVAEALAYAHSLGVLHLDLKPANVLLDENGVPHVADFGLARRLDSALALDNDEVSGTPAYMAPEQALARTHKITPATDVWGLGAILYELLTGQPPFRAHGAQATLQLVIEGHIERPRRWVPKLPLDLEAIVLKCMAKDPGERYASARDLADDLGRFIEHRAVRARRLNVFERVGRWTRREPRLAAAVILVAVALLAGLFATAQQWRRAERNAGRAEAVRGFLVGVFQQSNPDENHGQPFTAHQLLEKGEAQLAGGRQRDPAIEADITALLGRLYIDISDFQRSKALIEHAAGMVDARDIPDDVRARVLLGQAMIENEDGGYVAALGHARRSLELLGPRGNDVEVASAHLAIEKALLGSGDKDGARGMIEASLPSDRKALGDGHVLVADQWVQLGNVLASVGRFDDSDAAFKRAIASFSAASGARSNGVAHALNEYSNMLEDKGELKAAEAALDEALDIRMATVGADHHDTIAVENNLLWLLEFEGRYEEALPRRQQMLERATRAGLLHPQDRVSSLASLGKDYRELGDFTRAVAKLHEAVDLSIQTGGAHSQMCVLSTRQLGLAQILAGDYAGAESSLRETLAILRAHDPPSSPTLNLVRADIGKLLRLQHHPRQAVEELQAANDALAPTSKKGNTSLPLAMADLAEAQLDAGDASAAAKTAEDALARARGAYVARHYALGIPLFALARARLARGDAAGAEPLLREALAVRQPPHPANDPRILEVKVALVATLVALDRTAQAHQLRKEIEPLLASLQTPYAVDLRARLAAVN